MTRARGVFLLAAGLLCGAATLYADETKAGQSACFNCEAAKAHATAAYLWSASGPTPSTSSLFGSLHFEIPVSTTKNAPRPYVQAAFLSMPGQAIPNPATFDSIEGEAGLEMWFAKNLGVQCGVWANQKVNTSNDPNQPLAPSTFGWGCGPTGRGGKSSHVSILAGKDNHAGDQGGMQFRIRAKLEVPHTSIKDGGPIGSLYVDTRASLTSAPAPASAVPPPPGTPPPTQLVLNQTILFGIAIDADAIWGALFRTAASSGQAGAEKSAVRPPEISKAPARDARVGPPSLSRADLIHLASRWPGSR